MSETVHIALVRIEDVYNEYEVDRTLVHAITGWQEVPVEEYNKLQKAVRMAHGYTHDDYTIRNAAYKVLQEHLGKNHELSNVHILVRSGVSDQKRLMFDLHALAEDVNNKIDEMVKLDKKKKAEAAEKRKQTEIERKKKQLIKLQKELSGK